MEEDENPKQKPDTSFNRRLSVVKNWGEHDNGQENFLKFNFIGEHDKGEYGKGYYDTLILSKARIVEMDWMILTKVLWATTTARWRCLIRRFQILI